MAYGNWWNGKLGNSLYKNVTIYCDLLASFPVDGYWLDSDEVEFDSDCNELPDVGPMNLKKKC